MKEQKESETRLICREHPADSLGTVGTERFHTFKRIRQTELAVLEGAEGMIGQYLYLLYHIIVGYMFAKSA